LDDEEKLSIITITGKIDFASISKLSDSLNKEMKIDNHGETPSMDKGTK